MISDFTTAELIPIVSYLSEKYTGKESSSITYDKARDLMNAVIYCINEAGSSNTSSIAARNLSAGEQYDIGYELVVEKVKRTKEKYNRLITYFNGYGNVFYEDTVISGLSAFFVNYDAKFAPANHLLTLDYPILKNINNITGINRIEKYIDCICLEQLFLNSIDESFVLEILST